MQEPGRRWYRTGDAGEWDGQRLTVTGRLDDVIVITGGEKVSLGLVERAVQALPGLGGRRWSCVRRTPSGATCRSWSRRGRRTSPRCGTPSRSGSAGRRRRAAHRGGRPDPLLASGKPDRRAPRGGPRPAAHSAPPRMHDRDTGGAAADGPACSRAIAWCANGAHPGLGARMATHVRELPLGICAHRGKASTTKRPPVRRRRGRSGDDPGTAQRRAPPTARRRSRGWIGAARPRTLPARDRARRARHRRGLGAAAARAPTGSRSSRSRSALLLQIGVNFANDYSDGIRGTDRYRVGPARLTASGAAKPRTVLTVGDRLLRARRRRGLVHRRRHPAVVAARRRRRGDRRRLVLHRRQAAVRLRGFRRDRRLPVLRRRRDGRHQLRDRAAS